MYIGNFKNLACFISAHAPNVSVCLTGISGSGKTVRMQKIELDCAKRGQTVLVVDTNRTHTGEQIFLPLRREYEVYTNRINAVKDGVDIKFLTPITGQGGTDENFLALVNSAVNALTAGQRFGVKQIGILRSAVIEAIKNRGNFATDVEAVAYFLLSNKKGAEVYQKLWTILKCGVLRPSNKRIEYGKINVLDFSGLDLTTKNVLAEIVLSEIWRKATSSNAQEFGRLILSLDEFQALSWKPEAVMCSILREGRKFGVQVIMATQSLSVFPRDVIAILNQTATYLIFRPATIDLHKTAKTILLDNAQKWIEELNNLRVGESLAVGNFIVDGCEVNHPLRLN